MQGDLSEVGRRARRRIASRLLPFVFIMYVICYVDRANLSFANLRMSADLGFSDRVYGLGSGIFFIGYVLFEVPVVIGTRIPVKVLWRRSLSGESIPFIAKDYGIEESAVRNALMHVGVQQKVA